MKARQHYADFLGNIYSWMAGDFNEKMQEQKQFFIENGITPKSSEIAIDLGAAHGVQSIALAHCGYCVTAVDFNTGLLEELNRNKADLNVTTVEDEILHFFHAFTDKAELIVCMGDTLTHLESVEQVDRLVREATSHLESHGKIILSFRDLTTELKDEERFVMVKSDSSRILTCFLEFHPDQVIVHDILHERKESNWILKVSSYPKLRLSELMVADIFRKHQLELVKSTVINRMTYLIGQRRN